MSVKFCSHTVGNVSRYLPAGSAVHQPPAPQRDTEGRLITVAAQGCTDRITVIIFLYLRAEQVAFTCF